MTAHIHWGSAGSPQWCAAAFGPTVPPALAGSAPSSSQSLARSTHSSLVNEGYHLLFAVIDSIEIGSGQTQLGIPVCANGFSCPREFLIYPYSCPFQAFLPNCWSDWPMAILVPAVDAKATAFGAQSTRSHRCRRFKPCNKSFILIVQDSSASLTEPWHIIPILQIQAVPGFDFTNHLPDINTEFHSHFDVYEIAFKYVANWNKMTEGNTERKKSRKCSAFLLWKEQTSFPYEK